MKTFWGIPLWRCALVCLALTALWIYLWPRDRVSAASGMRFVILRWFHALTWALLALAALVGMTGEPWTPMLCRTLAFGALTAYGLFVAAMLGIIR